MKVKNKLFKKNKINAGVLEDQEISRLQEQYDTIDTTKIETFKDIPISYKTMTGLRDAGYTRPTHIQKEAISFALQGKDVLGSAITGSGKTLAFLVPIMEALYINKFTRMDGVGAIIISPTRELAYQTFETLKKIGVKHDFSAGLIIGGKNLRFERTRMNLCNIVICTPGRLLQHMDENPLFDCSSMRILVLDEADRCLDLGFEQTMNAIIENLPPSRQTLLFSATQTKSVKDLARLSLTSPIYVEPKEQSSKITPENLQQNYVVLNLEEKITMLWSFIKNHRRHKCIVFMSSCKQVKFVYEIFCKLRPGISLLALYGTLHQDRRMAIYNEFCRKSHVVLFATDVASRGLDFPVVNWVIQLDCPEDIKTYIHRAGRTARNNAQGENLLVLLPSEEEGMVEELKQKEIPISKISIDPKRLFSPRVKMEAFVAQSQELRETAQRAVVSYVKSVMLMKNKKVFNVDELDIDAFSRSLGLVITPRIRFLQRRNKNKNIQVNNNDTKLVSKPNILDFNVPSDEENEDEDLFTVKRKDHELPNTEEAVTEDDEPLLPIPKKEKAVSKAALAKRVNRKRLVINKRVLYDDEGNEITDGTRTAQSELAKEYANSDAAGIDIKKAIELLKEEDKFDKKRYNALVKTKHKERKRKLKDQVDENLDDLVASESEEDYEPDLSWMPDPTKIYNTENSEDDGNSNDDDDDDFKDRVHHDGKRLIVTKRDENNQATKKKLTEKLTLNEAEDLALALLS